MPPTSVWMRSSIWLETCASSLSTSRPPSAGTRASKRPVRVISRSVSSKCLSGAKVVQVMAPPPMSPSTTTDPAGHRAGREPAAACDRARAWSGRLEGRRLRAAGASPLRAAQARCGPGPTASLRLRSVRRRADRGRTSPTRMARWRARPRHSTTPVGRTRARRCPEACSAATASAQAVDARAVEAGRVVGQLDAHDLVVPLDQRPLEQPVGQHARSATCWR